MRSKGISQTALVPDPGPFDIETTSAKLKKYKYSGSDQILAEMIKLLISSIWSKNHLISGRSLLLYQFTRRLKEPTVLIIKEYHCCQLDIKCYLISFPHEVYTLTKFLGIISVGFDVMD
jgi:hypothetical protein